MTQENFPYMVTVSAPEEYPIEVHQGYLSNGLKDLICGVPKAGMEQAGWHGDGSKAGQGSNVIPSHLYLTYVAYAEKKFYTVDADLPKDKILQLFRQGFLVQDNSKQTIVDGQEHYEMVPGTYDTFTIGAAPGGIIVIWLSGNHHRTEVCRLQAKEVFVDKNDFMGFTDTTESQQQFFDELYKITVPDSIKAEITKSGIPFGLWDKYREKFNYRFVLNPYDEEDNFTHNYYLYFNGEADELFAKDLEKNEYLSRGIPYNCTYIMKKYSTEIFFNDKEMLEVFNNLKSKHPDKPIDIIITPTFMYNDMKVSVKCEDEIIPLTKYQVKGVWGG
ncbi:DUF2931 family protein [Kaistella carnis]|nr:DUF2931 family protein [Kaistella carnis]